MVRLLLDTQFWVHMDRNTKAFERFYSLVSSADDVEVLFCYGNFMDIIKADNQDNLSVIIGETVDTYLREIPVEGDEYEYSSDPVDVVPDDVLRRLLKRRTSEASVDASIRAIVATSDWLDPDDEWKEMAKEWKKTSDEYGFKYLLALAFEEYLKESNEDEVRLDIQDIDINEYIKKMVIIHRISLIGPMERLSANDFADLEIVSAAITTDCDLVAVEQKWDNVGLFERVSEELTNDEPTVVSNFDDLMAELERLLGIQ